MGGESTSVVVGSDDSGLFLRPGSSGKPRLQRDWSWETAKDVDAVVSMEEAPVWDRTADSLSSSSESNSHDFEVSQESISALVLLSVGLVGSSVNLLTLCWSAFAGKACWSWITGQLCDQPLLGLLPLDSCSLV